MPDHQLLHLNNIINQPISKLAPFSGLILTIAACAITVLRIYFIELVIVPKVYSLRTTELLTGCQRRSFINHNVAAGTKVLLIAATSYPLLAIIARDATPHTPFVTGASVTLGDPLMIHE